MNKLITTGVALLLASCLQAQEQAPAFPAKHSFSFRFDGLYSTHDDIFKGASMIWDTRISKHLAGGAGISYAYAPSHPDNGWNLYHLHFLPLFADLTWFPWLAKSPVQVYFRTSEGISFNSYKKQVSPDVQVTGVSEAGFFAYEGAGIGYSLGRQVALQGECGIKGFHLSGNNLDVNPHGITFSLGIAFFE